MEKCTVYLDINSQTRTRKLPSLKHLYPRSRLRNRLLILRNSRKMKNGLVQLIEKSWETPIFRRFTRHKQLSSQVSTLTPLLFNLIKSLTQFNLYWDLLHKKIPNKLCQSQRLKKITKIWFVEPKKMAMLLTKWIQITFPRNNHKQY
jgi:hypothetical protein